MVCNYSLLVNKLIVNMRAIEKCISVGVIIALFRAHHGLDCAVFFLANAKQLLVILMVRL